MQRTPSSSAVNATPWDTWFDDAIRARGATPPRTLAPRECSSSEGRRCPLCVAGTIDYETEADLKERALKAYWASSHPDMTLGALVRSPRGRGYRAVTKRKVFLVHGRPTMGLIEPGDRELRPFDALQCAIEPTSHAAVYDVIRGALLQPRFAALTDELSYVVLKGHGNNLFLLFNVRRTDQQLVASANDLSKLISRSCPGLAGTFLYVEPKGGRYYLGSSTAAAGPALRKLYGAASLKLSAAGLRFSYGPLSFTQVNHAILDRFIAAAAGMLALSPGSRFYDLYCGFGLFALSLAGSARSVTGIERSPDAIADARENARNLGIRNARFVRSDIDAESLARALAGSGERDRVLLDPPRGGTAAGVIECIAARRPARVVHIVCAMELLDAEIRRWEQSGYRVSRAVPFDMFPGTADLEMMMMLEPATGGAHRIRSKGRSSTG